MYRNSFASEQQQQKALPLSYIRTYSYHPLTIQTPQVPTSYRFVPSTNNLFTPQMMAKSSPAGTFSAQTILAPTNLVSHGQNSPQQSTPNSAPPPPPPASAPMPTFQHSPSPFPAQQPQQFSNYPDMAGFHSMIQPSQPLPPHPQILPAPQHQPMRQNNFYPENPFSQFQYMPTPPQYNLQQVQFVPCMCPVTLSMNPEIAPQAAEKRVDEQIPSTTNIEPQAMMEVSAETKA